MTLDDLNAVSELEKRSQVAPWTRDHFVSELQKDHSEIWIVTDDATDERLYGYIVFSKVLDAWQILNLAVDSSVHRHGVGQALLEKVKNQAIRNHVRLLVLEVRKSNTPAVQLYQKVGFRIVRTHPNYYSNGEGAYMMEVVLSEEPPVTGAI